MSHQFQNSTLSKHFKLISWLSCLLLLASMYPLNGKSFGNGFPYLWVQNKTNDHFRVSMDSEGPTYFGKNQFTGYRYYFHSHYIPPQNESNELVEFHTSGNWVYSNPTFGYLGAVIYIDKITLSPKKGKVHTLGRFTIGQLNKDGKITLPKLGISVTIIPYVHKIPGYLYGNYSYQGLLLIIEKSRNPKGGY